MIQNISHPLGNLFQGVIILIPKIMHLICSWNFPRQTSISQGSALLTELGRCSAAEISSLSSLLSTGLAGRCLQQGSEHIPRGCHLSRVLFQAQWSQLKESWWIQKALSEVLNLQPRVWGVKANSFSYTQKLLSSLQKARGHVCTDKASPLHLLAVAPWALQGKAAQRRACVGFYSDLI